MILITGSTGFIGRSVTNALTLAGREWQPYSGRINNPLALRQQLADVQQVIHLVGSEWRGRHRLLQHVDVEGTERLVEECQRANVQKLVVVSRLGANPDSLHPLLRAKGQIERLVQKSGIPYTILQSGMVYGRNDRSLEIMLSLALWSWPFVLLPGGGVMPMQPLWVEDLARCLLIALDQPELINKTIPIAGDERYHYKDIMNLLLQTVNSRRLPLKVPLVTLRPLTTLLFRWWWWPAITHYTVDRFFVPEITQLDTILHHFYFHPTRLSDTLAYLNRPGLRWRLFRR